MVAKRRVSDTFSTLSGWRHYLQKVILDRNKPRGSLEHYFPPFRARGTQIYEKGPPWSFIFRVFFKLSKHEKDSEFYLC